MIHRITPSLREYTWGCTTTIPDLLGMEPSGAPVAEAWFGEVASVADLETGEPPRSVADLVASDRQRALGSFEQFPFLVKLLAAAEPLSIQLHPDTATARVGFDREEASGVAVDSPVRVYRDRRAKPEAMVALEPFEMLCGFREPSASVELIEHLELPQLSGLVERLRGAPNGLADAIAELCSFSAAELSELISPLVAACAARPPAPHRRQCEWIATIGVRFPDDVGVLFALLLEYHVLEPYDVVFVPPGVIHSYLCGSGLEVMENSDNVVRAGLTPKHIAVEELLRIASFEPGGQLIERCSSHPGPLLEHRFDDVPFAVDLLQLDGQSIELAVAGPEIYLVLDGRAKLSDSTDRPASTVELARGSAAFVEASTTTYTVSGRGRVARVTAVERRSTLRVDS